jgi:hypothetical protein
VTGLGWASGGYFPSEWGLAILAFALVAGTIVVVADAPHPGGLAVGFLCGLAALAVWSALSTLWSPGAAAPVLELERGLVYVAAAAAAILLVATLGEAPALLGGVVAGAVVLSLYALATRLFPGDVGGAYDPSSGYQLAEPIGYWNALGLLAALAILIAVALAAHVEDVIVRALAAASLVVLLPTLYFTFSRGALIALVLGAAVQVVVDPRRARLLVAGLVLGAPAAAGVLYASRFHALTAPGDSLTTAQGEGRRVATMLVVLALVAVATAVAFDFGERRLRLPARAGMVVAATVAVAAAIAAVGFLAAVGGPVAAVERVHDEFTAPLRPGESDLDRRLLSVSGNGRGDYWRVAADMVRDEPLLGHGAGSFEAQWLLRRPVAFHARDAHNLYLETLAELGPLGLALLLGTLAVPLLALLHTRRRPLVPAAAGAFAAYLVHAGIDWDWELPVVTVPAILCGVVLLARPDEEAGAWLTGRRRLTALALLVPLVGVALVAHVGNRAAAAGIAALENGEPERALLDARRGASWAWWSEDAWQLRGEAELGLGNDVAARRSLARALELNDRSWSIWFDLAVASSGRERAQALQRAKALNPLSPEVEELQTER